MLLTGGRAALTCGGVIGDGTASWLRAKQHFDDKEQQTSGSKTQTRHTEPLKRVWTLRLGSKEKVCATAPQRAKR